MLLCTSDDFIKGRAKLRGTGMQVKEVASRVYWECKAEGCDVVICNDRFLLITEHGKEKTFAFRKDNKAGCYTAKLFAVKEV